MIFSPFFFSKAPFALSCFFCCSFSLIIHVFFVKFVEISVKFDENSWNFERRKKKKKRLRHKLSEICDTSFWLSWFFFFLKNMRFSGLVLSSENKWLEGCAVCARECAQCARAPREARAVSVSFRSIPQRRFLIFQLFIFQLKFIDEIRKLKRLVFLL